MKRLLLPLLLVIVLMLSVSAAHAADPVAVTSLTLNQTSASIPVKKTVTLKAVIAPTNATKKAVEWFSSDESIATVKNGLVTGVNPGMAIITASATDGSGVSVSAEITVVKPVSRINPDNSSLVLPPDVAWEIFWTVEPQDATNRNIVWSSSNTNIATVNDHGVIFTHGVGSCTITAAAEDGSGVKTPIKVTVKDHDIVILEPGAVNVDFETESKSVSITIVEKGKTVTKSCTQYFVTENGCVKSPENAVIVPVKAGSDTIQMQFIQSRKTLRINRYSVFVARSAVGESIALTEDGQAKPIRFLGLKWGSNYPEAQNAVEARGRTLKSLSKKNDYLRAMMEGDLNFANITAFRVALNFTYIMGDRLLEARNSLFKADLYFDPEIPYETVAQAAKNVYSLDGGNQSGNICTWERGSVQVVLTKEERYTHLELIWNGEDEPEEAETAQAAEEDSDFDEEDDEDSDFDEEDDEDF